MVGIARLGPGFVTTSQTPQLCRPRAAFNLNPGRWGPGQEVAVRDTSV